MLIEPRACLIALQNLGLTQNEIAAQTGISQPTLSRIKRHDIDLPFRRAQKLAELLERRTSEQDSPAEATHG